MKKIIVFLTFIILTISCSNSDDTLNNLKNSQDVSAILTNWADNIIVPSYVNYQSKVQVLVTDVNTFNATPNVANLQTLRTSWLGAYKAYQYIAMYNFGKPEAINIKESSNTYPTNTDGINNNISTGTYNLSLNSQFNKQGFPALDYLLNGLSTTDELIVEFYTTNTAATKYKEYLLAITTRLKTNIDLVVTDWNTNFRTSYVENNGTSIISSLNITTNNFVKNFEKDIRTGKVGIVAGIFSSGVKFPDKVEAFYKKDVSKILLNEALKASQDFFNGKHFNSEITGEGLKSYLDLLNVVRNGQKLSDIINNQFTTISQVSNGLDNNFSLQINTDNSKMLTLYEAMQKNVIYTKLDMMQGLNISIDYVDRDND